MQDTTWISGLMISVTLEFLAYKIHMGRCMYTRVGAAPLASTSRAHSIQELGSWAELS